MVWGKENRAGKVQNFREIAMTAGSFRRLTAAAGAKNKSGINPDLFFAAPHTVSVLHGFCCVCEIDALLFILCAVLFETDLFVLFYVAEFWMLAADFARCDGRQGTLSRF